ncbi:DinB family protein [Gillisia sp. Hel_I_86]|uniref:DinB family protein n=1 Tax=Gillisia sp. Hel_I_86 TaxID=1249981 RepID=UPI00119AE2CB|nr:DinB family protein [Gillisia sp. Hel_I_86]TVZ27225.1 DinB family protein [Gillisia sp. Hel_I_86]
MQQPEYWLRGKIEHIPDLLQPVAHSLMQSKEEVRNYMDGFPEHRLWEKPAERASIGFHLQHLFGVLDRLLSYTKKENLSEEQFLYFKKEGVPDSSISSEMLIKKFEDKVLETIKLLEEIPPSSLTEFRGVGRKQMPSTVIGLLFHAAEHTQRHIGQLLVTASVLKS